MINEWEDYYRILQVHFMAELDIIRSAYLRLSKKYHPDSNNGLLSEEKMKSINKAYEVLSKNDTRIEYDISWVKKNRDYHNSQKEKMPSQQEKINIDLEPIREVLSVYLLAISKGEFDKAYKMLTEQDKKMISVKEFKQWQTLVGEVFKLKSYTCDFDSSYGEVQINNNRYEACIKMHVKVFEENLIMEQVEEDEFYKNVVCENEEWHICLGYNNLKGIIEKFSALSRLNKLKTESANYAEPLQKNKKKFMQMAEREQMRFNRYGNKFSVIVCNVKSGYIDGIEVIIKKLLRKLDLTCRWNKNTQIILLPETDEKAAQLVVNKIKKAILTNFNKNNEELLTFHIVQQHYANLDDLMNNFRL